MSSWHYGHSTGQISFPQEHNQVSLLAGIEPATLRSASDCYLQHLLAHDKISALLLPFVVILERYINPYRPQSTLYIVVQCRMEQTRAKCSCSWVYTAHVTLCALSSSTFFLSSSHSCFWAGDAGAKVPRPLSGMENCCSLWHGKISRRLGIAPHTVCSNKSGLAIVPAVHCLDLARD